MATKKIHSRGLTSFFTLFGFLIMSITGLVLYVVPAGRVAYWVTWEMIGLTKTDWGNIHILSSILFIVAGGFHTYFNWKPLMNYFKDKVTSGIKLRRELAISSIVSIWIVISALFPFPPLSYLLDFNEYVKAAWIVQDDYEPPIGHAELLTLRVFSKRMEIDIEKAANELKAKGIAFESIEETLEDIAAKNGTSPMEIYLLIKQFEPTPEPEKLNAYTAQSIDDEFSGTGIGNKTLSAVCEKLGLENEVAVERLNSVNMAATVDQTLKSISENNDTDPIEIMKAILLDDYKPQPEGH